MWLHVLDVEFFMEFLHADSFTTCSIFISLQVVEEAKKMIEASPNQKFVVHEFKADANAKVIK